MVSNAKRQTLVIAPSLTLEGIALTVIALTLPRSGGFLCKKDRSTCRTFLIK